MKYKIILLIAILFIIGSVSQKLNAQNAEIDSLKLVDKNFKLEENYKTDTLYLQNVNSLSFEYLRTNPDTVIVLSKKIVPLCKNVNYNKGIANALRRIGTAYKYIGEIDSSLFYFEKSYEEFSNFDNKKGMSKINFDLAGIYRIQGKSELAIENYEKALIYFTEINNSLYIAFTLNNIAVVYQMQGRLTEAIQYYYKILELFEKENNRGGLISAHNNIGIILEIQKKYDEAILNYEKSLEISTELNRFFDMVNTMSNISNIYIHQAKHDKALLLLKQSIEINIKSNNPVGEANNYMQICELYCNTENYDSAKIYIDKSKKLNKELKDKILEYKILYYGASIDYSENKIEKALEKALDAHDMIIKVGDVEKQRQVNFLICKLYEANNNYEKSLFYYKKYKQYSDSITKNDNLKKTELIQAEYEYLQKETNLLQENEKHLQAITKQRYTILIFVIALVSIFVILLLIYRKKQQKQRDYLLLQKKNNQIKEQSEEIKIHSENLKATNKKLIELDEYKQTISSMIVHDLKNPLNAISSFSTHSAVKSSAKKMYHLVNNILDVNKFQDAKMKLNIKQFELLELINNTLPEIEYLLLQKNITISNLINKKIVVNADKNLIERVLINLINNAVKFSDNNSSIIINYEKIADNEIRISIKDAGVGISEEEIEHVFDKFSHTAIKNKIKSTGLGLTFCKMAVEAMNGKIGVVSQLNIGSQFWFTVPLIDILAVENNNSQKVEKQKFDYLSKADKETLFQYIDKLKNFEIYEISLIKKVVSEMKKENSKGIQTWLKQYETAIYNTNQQEVTDLLNLV